MNLHYKRGKRFVVRSDLGNKPIWLERATNCRNLLLAFGTTERVARAYEFTTRTRAQEVADAWSDFPGVWRVLVRPAQIHA